MPGTTDDQEFSGQRIFVATDRRVFTVLTALMEMLDTPMLVVEKPIFTEDDLEGDVLDPSVPLTIVWVACAPANYLEAGFAQHEIIGPTPEEVTEYTDTHRLEALQVVVDCLWDGRGEFARLQG